MGRVLREFLKKYFPADGLGWKIPSLVAAIIAIVGGVAALIVWARGALSDFFTADLEVWHLLLALGAEATVGIVVAVWRVRRSASRESPAPRKVVPYPEEVEHLGVIWPISTMIVGGTTPEFNADKPACPRDRSTLGLAVDDVTLPLDEDWEYLGANDMRFRCFKDGKTYDLTEHKRAMNTALAIVQSLAEGQYRTTLARVRGEADH